jgi:hypothetical protein
MWVAALWSTLLALAVTRPHVCDEWSVAAPATAVAQPVRAAPVTSPPPVPSALARAERTRYRIDYGVLEIGALEVVIAAAVPGATLVHADGHGSGGVLGLGHMDDRIATDFDLTRLDSRSWDNARSGGEGELRDRALQTGAGHVDLVRDRAGGAGPEKASVVLAAPLLDPLGLLLRLRVEPPGASAQILYVLDGQALWRVTITNAGRVVPPENAARVPMIRLEAQAEPMRWNGTPDTDGDRTHRSFKLWLSDDAAHVPLRLEMPVGIADVVVALTEIARSAR